MPNFRLSLGGEPLLDTLALKAAEWFRRDRRFMVFRPLERYPRSHQAGFPLIPLSNSVGPPLLPHAARTHSLPNRFHR